MSVTYYVTMPFIRTEEGSAPGQAQECPGEGAAIRRAEVMSRDPTNVAVGEIGEGGVFVEAHSFW